MVFLMICARLISTDWSACGNNRGWYCGCFQPLGARAVCTAYVF